MLKRTIFCGMCLAGLLVVTSCNHQVQKNIAFENPINSFPQSMVGLWEARTGIDPGERWRIKFEEDGSIQKIEHLTAGRLVITKGGNSGEGPEKDTGFVFVLGPCVKEFDPKTGILALEINLDYFEMVLPQGTLSGRQKDTFVGKISSDGETWEVDWRSYGWLDEAQEPDIKEIDENPVKITFKKIDIESLKKQGEAGVNN